MAALPASMLALIVCFAPVAQASQQVAVLNRVTFAGNVLANKENQESEGPDAWVVLFCAEWFEPCVQFQEDFKTLALEHGDTSVDNLFSRTTRFAEVDCAIDKELCNTQDVDMYPTVVYYRNGGRVAEWIPGNLRNMDKEATKFAKWLKKTAEAPFKLVPDENDTETQARRPHSMGQLVPMLVLLAAGTVWVSRLGMELQQGVQFLREVRANRPSLAKKQLPESLKDEPNDIAVIRSLPETWVAERHSLEL